LKISKRKKKNALVPATWPMNSRKEQGINCGTTGLWPCKRLKEAAGKGQIRIVVDHGRPEIKPGPSLTADASGRSHLNDEAENAPPQVPRRLGDDLNSENHRPCRKALKEMPASTPGDRLKCAGRGRTRPCRGSGGEQFCSQGKPRTGASTLTKSSTSLPPAGRCQPAWVAGRRQVTAAARVTPACRSAKSQGNAWVVVVISPASSRSQPPRSPNQERAGLVSRPPEDNHNDRSPSAPFPRADAKNGRPTTEVASGHIRPDGAFPRHRPAALPCRSRSPFRQSDPPDGHQSTVSAQEQGRPVKEQADRISGIRRPVRKPDIQRWSRTPRQCGRRTINPRGGSRTPRPMPTRWCIPPRSRWAEHGFAGPRARAPRHRGCRQAPEEPLKGDDAEAIKAKTNYAGLAGFDDARRGHAT